MGGRGGTGRRWGLKILCHWRAGSIPAVRTTLLALGLLAGAGCGQRPDVGPVLVSAIGGDLALAGERRANLPEQARVLTDSVAEGLVRFDAAGQVEAGLAERWIVTDGGTSYIFRLRRAQWADGSPVRADDVVRLLRRQLDAGSRNPLAPYLTAVESVVEMTPEVIEVELSRPRPDLLKLFAQPELAIVQGKPPGGGGPFRVRRREAGTLLLRPATDPDRDPDAPASAPEDDVRLIGERAATAIVRFIDRGSDLVTGGTLNDWPILQAARPAPVNIRVDPAAGLLGLAIVRRDGFLSDAANRGAIAAAIDRAAIAAAISPEWAARETILPEQLDSAAGPAIASWAGTATLDERQAEARRQVTAWRAGGKNPPPTIAIALPDGPGGTLLWGHLARDLYAIGIRPERRPSGDRTADLRLIDRVAPYDSARWYLAEACVACSDAARDAIDAARTAPTLDGRARAIAAADAALTKDVAFVPLARPFRWSLVAMRLMQWQPNARAWHPLNRLRRVTN